MTVEVLAPNQRSLSELADAANQAHADVAMGLISALEHAVRAGEALETAHGSIPAGEWHRWCEENLQIPPRAIRYYRRLYVYRDHIPSHLFEKKTGAMGSPITPGPWSARPYLRGLPQLGTSPRRADTELMAEASRLRRQGVTLEEVATIMGVSSHCVWLWTTPGAMAKQRERTKRKQREDRAARRALERERAQKMIRANSGDISEAYSLIRRAQQRVDGLLAVSPSRGQRSGLRAALTALHKAEDCISTAMRAPEES